MTSQKIDLSSWDTLYIFPVLRMKENSDITLLENK
jgi:16S rRNA U1498 N3-methylase RsmE